MERTVLDATLISLDAAYRSDPFHALLRNLESVQDDEWAVRPANHSVDVFGTQPELSIADVVRHVGGAKLMWTNHALGDRTMKWEDLDPPKDDRAGLLKWLDDAHRGFRQAVEALGDDAELDRETQAPWGKPLTVRQSIAIVVNHDLYHSGEINRQRALIRGAQGWEGR